jgi:spermidine synthase
MQVSAHDHQQYDDLMCRCLKNSDKKVLILGGGDGFIAANLTRKNPGIQVKVVDLDPVVVDQVEKHFDQNVFDCPRAQLILGDAIQYVQNTTEEFDGIICDLTDAPVGAAEEQEFHDFYEGIIRASQRILTGSGWISIQGGAAQVSANFIDAAEILSSILKRTYWDVECINALIPSFGEECVFLSAANKKCLPLGE